MNNPKFQVFQSDSNQEYYFRLQAINGEIILGSQGYTAKQSCLNGIQSVKDNVKIDDSFEQKKSTNDQDYFVLKAGNNQVIGVSEMYNSKQAMENGISAVTRDAPKAPVEEV